MNFPEELLYEKSHEWVKVEGDTVIMGITDFAQSELGDVVFVELPSVGDEKKAGDQMGVLESVKAVSDFYSPVSGTVIEVNTELEASPDLINSSCYQDGWIAKLKLDSGVGKLLSAKKYKESIGSN